MHVRRAVWVLLSDTVSQSLVQIKYYELFGVFLEGQVDFSGLDLFIAILFQVLEEAYRLENMDGELSEDGPLQLLLLDHSLLLAFIVIVGEDVGRHGRGELSDEV
jgi:hypothetical protein